MAHARVGGPDTNRHSWVGEWLAMGAEEGSVRQLGVAIYLSSRRTRSIIFAWKEPIWRGPSRKRLASDSSKGKVSLLGPRCRCTSMTNCSTQSLPSASMQGTTPRRRRPCDSYRLRRPKGPSSPTGRVQDDAAQPVDPPPSTGCIAALRPRPCPLVAIPRWGVVPRAPIDTTMWLES